MTLRCEDIFSIFLSKITDYSFLEYSDDFAEAQMIAWLSSTISLPRLRAKFSSLTFDDSKTMLNFSLKQDVDTESDLSFVTDILARGMVVAWLEPQVKNVLLTKQMLGGKEEKFYAQANHLSELEKMLSTAKSEFNNILRDYGYLNNPYIKE